MAKPKKQFTTRHLGVMMEGIGKEVKVIAEQYGDIKSTMGEHGKKLDLLKEQYGDIKSTLHEHGKKLDEHGKKIDSHREMIGKLAMDVAVIKEDTEFIKHGLKRKVDVEEFAALEHRVALLEKKR